MRYKITFIVTIVIVIVIAVFFESATIPKNRYHQHEENIVNIAPSESTNENFSTHLPLMEIATDGPLPGPYFTDTDGQVKRNNETVSARVNYYDNETGNNSLENRPTISEKSSFRIRGRSSRSYNKHSYLLKFKDANLQGDKIISLSGMTPDNEWALHGPYLDKSLIRNYLCYNISGEIMDYSPNVRFCELVLNGEYAGLYVITEKTEYNPEGRIDISKTDPAMHGTSYIVSLDAGSVDSFHSVNSFGYHTEKFAPRNTTSEILEIEYPGKSLTAAQKKYIEDDISKFEKALVSYDFADKHLGYASFIDVDSFVDYFIINEFTMNKDAGRLSTYFYKDIRGKMKVAVWDFNSAFNNYASDISKPHYFVMPDKFWYRYLFKDPAFTERLIRRYEDLRKTHLSEEYLLNYIDETVAYLGPAVDRNNDRWKEVFDEENDMLRPTERNPRTYEESIQQLKQSLVQRGLFLDRNIEKLRALSHDSLNKEFAEGVAK